MDWNGTFPIGDATDIVFFGFMDPDGDAATRDYEGPSDQGVQPVVDGDILSGVRIALAAHTDSPPDTGGGGGGTEP